MNEPAVDPSFPAWDEAERLAALRRYRVLDTPRERAFDDIVQIAAHVCEAPIAVVNLIEDTRQWFKAEVGLGVRETPLESSFCAHAILQPGLFIIPDTTKDSRFACNPLVAGEPRFRFYAGALLETAEGLPLGTVCVLDTKPRELSPDQARTLEALARQVMTQLELRRALAERQTVLGERQRLASIVENSSAFIGISDLALRPIYVNEAGRRLVGLVDLDEACRLSVLDYFDPGELPRVEQEVFPAVAEQGRWTGELTFRHTKTGARIPVVYDVFRVDDPNTGRPTHHAMVTTDITQRKRAEQQQALLLRELHHRVKNTLATVLAIMGSTARASRTADEFQRAFTGRVASLAKTHSLLTEDRWQAVSFRELLRGELEPFDDDTGRRIKLEGPEVELPSDLALSLGMAVHELTTNAAKHGALSRLVGAVEVYWTVAPEPHGGRVLRCEWIERDGPPVQPPAREGFGSRLLQRVLTAQAKAEVTIDYRPDGLRAQISLPLAPSAGQG